MRFLSLTSIFLLILFLIGAAGCGEEKTPAEEAPQEIIEEPPEKEPVITRTEGEDVKSGLIKTEYIQIRPPEQGMLNKYPVDGETDCYVNLKQVGGISCVK